MGNRDEASGDGISIPYGAIKRGWVIEMKQVEMEFQFLMVRLKEVKENPSLYKELISIPYGAIKRAKHYTAPLKYHYFNSLWCD